MTEAKTVPTEEELQKMLSKAKMGLLLKGAVFVSTITFSLKHEFTYSVATASIDGTVFKYNPEFFAGLTEDERVNLLMHETGHVMFMHPIRGIGKKWSTYCIAADIVIDTYLQGVGYDQKKYGCVQPKYTNWTTAQVYDDLLQNPDKGPSEPRMYDIVVPSFSDDKTGAENTAQGIENKSPSKQQQQQLESDIKTILVKATTQSKMLGEAPGSIPGEVEQLIDQLINPKLDYTELLHRFMDSIAKNDYSWKKPNKRFLPNFYLPTIHSEELGEITVAIDTSGSISRSQMVGILSEIQHIYTRHKPTKMTILDCDTEIHNIYEIDAHTMDSILDLEFTGGGGTRFEPVMQYCKEQGATVLLYFTDLQARQITEEQDFPIIWVCYSNANPAPIGETIYYQPDTV